ncbi:MAG TPA: sporulation protein [Clostridiales bacterium]|nr:MAG: hypothetical protein A2Y22_09335 [Clostridiales bacterium GWD2_32_59]HAN10139.1 sporulation protein [Clostridiales bacterium]
MESNVSKNLKEMFKSLEEVLTTKTVIGEPITIDGIIIVPLLDISLGIGAGAIQSKDEKESVGGGMGAKISPNSLLIIRDGKPQVINIQNQEGFGKIIDMVPGIIAQFGLDKLVKKGKGKES